jgi:ribonuclease T1
VFSASGGRYAPGLRKFGLALLLGAGLATGVAQARGIATDFDTVALAQLPQEARDTEQLIRRGGPFPYAKDGTVFGNRERLLPRYKRGYYREYTVRTPGSRDRGARRIVCGGTQPAVPDACYYSADHYASFKRIVQ